MITIIEEGHNISIKEIDDATIAIALIRKIIGKMNINALTETGKPARIEVTVKDSDNCKGVHPKGHISSLLTKE